MSGEYIFTQTLEEALTEWAMEDMHFSERWHDISSTMNSIAQNVMVQDMRKRFRCDACDHSEEDQEFDTRIQAEWQLTKQKYIRYREQFMKMDFDNEDGDSKGKTNRDILERALAQDAESIILGAEVEF